MLKLTVPLLLLLTSLAGCSSTPTTQPQGQYCFTEETITNTDGSVSSETKIECSDKPKVNHLTKSAGVAQQCRSYIHTIQIQGVNRNVKGFLCKFPNGVWEPVNSAFAY